ATSRLTKINDGEKEVSMGTFPTPGVRTIEDLVTFPGGAAADHQIKTLVYMLDEKPALVLLRGDHSLNETKITDATGAQSARPAQAEEIRELLGALPGSLGAVGVKDVFVIADRALEGRFNMTTGANKDDHHIRGVSIARDITVNQWADLRAVAT